MGQSKSYSYDKAGRLVSANVYGNTYAYSFGAPTGCTGTYNANAGKNSNRTSQTVNGVATTYCYDYADRLISSSDQTLTTPTYDAHGNMTQIGTTYNVNGLQFGYDALDRTTLIRQNWGSDVNIQYYRDAQGRITYRGERGSKVPASDTYFGYTGPGDTPDFLVDVHANITEKYFQLPGGVVFTKRSSSGVYSLPDVHGDIMATVDQTGNNQTTFQYDPFGKLIGTNKPANITGGESLGWVGQNDKIAEYQFTSPTVELDARTYMPSLGRFTRADSIEGGNENPYVYPPDPVNDFDLTGTSFWDSVKKVSKIVTTVATIGSFIPGPIGIACSAVAVAGNVIQGNYAEAAIAATGLIGAGALTKIAAKAIDAGRAGRFLKGVGAISNRLARIQAKAPIIGVNSRLVGNMKWGTRMGAWNNKFSRIKFGWSHYQTVKGGPIRSTFRLGWGGGKHFDFLVGGAW